MRPLSSSRGGEVNSSHGGDMAWRGEAGGDNYYSFTLPAARSEKRMFV